MTNAIYKAIADPTRREIMELLSGKTGLSVQEIADHFTMSRPAISKHLKILKEARLVGETPDGRQRFYEVEIAPLETVADWLAGLAVTGGASAREDDGEASREERLSRDEFEDQWGDRLPAGSGALQPPASDDWRSW